MSAFPTGCLGKLPLHGDFIRFNASSGEVNELDTWVQEGIYRGYEKLDSKWDSAFDAAPTARFMYCSPKSRRILAGLFKPSVDKAGRRYPFMVYTIIEPNALGNDISYLPWAMDAFLLKATEQAAWSDSAIDLNTFLSSFNNFGFTPDLVEARKNFAKYVLVTSAGDYWASAYGSADDARKYAAVQLTAWGADLRPPESNAIRYPVSDPDAEAGFWIELARRFGGGTALPTLALWNQAAGDHPARLHLGFGKLNSEWFLPFVLPGTSGAVVKDLSAMESVDASLVDRAKAQFDEVLSEASLKLSDLLQRLPRSKGD